MLWKKTIFDGSDYILLHTPRYRLYEQWIEDNPIYDSVHRRVRLQESFKTLQLDVVDCTAAEDPAEICPLNSGGRRFDLVRCVAVANLEHIDEASVDFV